MVYDDGDEGVFETQRDAPRTSLWPVCTRPSGLGVLDRRTQHHPLSAAINNPTVCKAQEGTGSIVLVAVAVGEHDSAADGSQLKLHTEPRGSLCAEACRAIEADLVLISPGHAAAHDVRGRAVIYISQK